MLTYYSIDMGSELTLVLILPMMAYIFYHKLQKYISLGKSENQGQRATNSYRNFCLVLFAVQIVSNIVACVDLYEYSDIQDTEDYAL